RARGPRGDAAADRGLGLTVLADLEVDDAGAGSLERLRSDDALGQLLERRGLMAELATEAGDVKLDWVDGIARALEDPARLDGVEAAAADLARGRSHLVWAGMGGSVGTVHALRGAGLLDTAAVAVHPLDSTDPAALNRLLAAIGDVERAAMIGVS